MLEILCKSFCSHIAFSLCHQLLAMARMEKYLKLANVFKFKRH